jgi:hypothetical protein
MTWSISARNRSRRVILPLLLQANDANVRCRAMTELRRSGRLLEPALLLLDAREGQRDGGPRRPDHRPDHGQAGAGADEGWLPIRDPIHGHAGLLWRRYLSADAFSGVAGNLVTTATTCLLAWALLYPQGLLPQG